MWGFFWGRHFFMLGCVLYGMRFVLRARLLGLRRGLGHSLWTTLGSRMWSFFWGRHFFLLSCFL
jgi:hypothetical protein